ncbi:MAG: nucleotidyltransferase domain-containing protein [Nanoarchaeota archaeon]
MRSKSYINNILKEVLNKIKPSQEDMKKIEISLDSFVSKLNAEIAKKKINSEIFIGGSFAKNTLIKKDHYDIDIFLRFEGHKEEELSKLTESLIKGINTSVVHGSRDYFRIKIDERIFFEVVPVKKVTKTKDAENITDLSYSHVKYINKKIKNKNILDEIRIAKAFCYANHCYGAESYINGFSGYALELLIYYYGSFAKFLKEMARIKSKTVIDIEKHYKNKNQVMMDVNSAKLNSPVILIDPTYKQRNALAALSQETFDKFKKSAEDFLKKPSLEAFEVKKTDLEKIKKSAKSHGEHFILIEALTDKQAGDIAGSKLLKFYKHLDQEISKFFRVKNKGFNYNKENSARYFFVVKSREEILLQGPETKDEKNLIRFRKKHKTIFTKKNRMYAKEKVRQSIKEFLDDWKKKNHKKMTEMYIKELRVVD